MVMSLRTVRAVFGTNMRKVPAVQSRAQAMHDGFAADPGTYANPPIALPDFLARIQKLSTSHQAVKTRVVGARQTRDADLGALVTDMVVLRAFVQSIADKNASRAEAIITNGGLVVGTVPVRTKALLTLRNAKQSGSITCDACVKLLVGAGTAHPNQSRFFGWQLTADGGKTFTTLPSTSRHKTVVTGLTPLTEAGVRVNLTNSEGTGPWTDVVTIVVR
jgi:hypothetical protein